MGDDNTLHENVEEYQGMNIYDEKRKEEIQKVFDCAKEIIERRIPDAPEYLKVQNIMRLLYEAAGRDQSR